VKGDSGKVEWYSFVVKKEIASLADHLIRKPGESTWYVTLIIPADVRPAFGGRTKLTKTTGTSSRPQAMIDRLPILAHWKALIAEAREQKLNAGDLWRASQHQLGLTIQTQRAAAANLLFTPVDLNTPPPTPPKSSTALIEEFRQHANELRADGAVDMADRLSDHANKLAAAIENGMTPAVAMELQNSLLAIWADGEAFLKAHEFNLTDDEHKEAKAIVRNPTTYTPVSPITPARLEKFRQHRLESVEHRTVNMQESKLKQLSDYLAQGNVLNHETVAEWLEIQCYSSRTKVQYLSAFTTFWNWAVKNDSYWKVTFKNSPNPFKGHALPRQSGKERKKTERKDFTPEQLVHLHSVAKSQGQDTLSDVIMLAAYTGCRIEEIGQLRTENIIKVEGVLSFDIEESKTKAGIRQIPVHPTIQTTVERLIAESKDGFLLPSVNKKNLYGRRSDAWSKSFGKLKKSEGFSSQHVFHSIRATTITQLLRADVQGHIVASIVGHGTDVLTYDVYHKGASPMQKLEAISKLSFRFN